MTTDQAAQLISTLAMALREALQEGQSTVSMTAHLQAADDAARAELEAAIESLQALAAE